MKQIEFRRASDGLKFKPDDELENFHQCSCGAIYSKTKTHCPNCHKPAPKEASR